MRRIDIEFVVEDKIYGRAPSTQIKRKKYDISDLKHRKNADVHWYMIRRYQPGSRYYEQDFIGPAKNRPAKFMSRKPYLI